MCLRKYHIRIRSRRIHNNSNRRHQRPRRQCRSRHPPRPRRRLRCPLTHHTRRRTLHQLHRTGPRLIQRKFNICVNIRYDIHKIQSGPVAFPTQGSLLNNAIPAPRLSPPQCSPQTTTIPPHGSPRPNSVSAPMFSPPHGSPRTSAPHPTALLDPWLSHSKALTAPRVSWGPSQRSRCTPVPSWVCSRMPTATCAMRLW